MGASHSRPPKTGEQIPPFLWKMLEFFWFSCYNSFVNCENLLKNPGTGCIFLLMQPTPLTGTATSKCSNKHSKVYRLSPLRGRKQF